MQRKVEGERFGAPSRNAKQGRAREQLRLMAASGIEHDPNDLPTNACQPSLLLQELRLPILETRFLPHYPERADDAEQDSQYQRLCRLVYRHAQRCDQQDADEI